MQVSKKKGEKVLKRFDVLINVGSFHTFKVYIGQSSVSKMIGGSFMSEKKKKINFQSCQERRMSIQFYQRKCKIVIINLVK